MGKDKEIGHRLVNQKSEPSPHREAIVDSISSSIVDSSGIIASNTHMNEPLITLETSNIASEKSNITKEKSNTGFEKSNTASKAVKNTRKKSSASKQKTA